MLRTHHGGTHRGTWLEGDALAHEGLLLGRARPTTVSCSDLSVYTKVHIQMDPRGHWW